MDFYRHLFLTDGPGKTISFAMVYLLSTVFAFQTLLTAYTSSSYLEQFIASEYVGFVYIIASIGAIIMTVVSPRILRAVGNVGFVLGLMTTIIITLLLIGFAFTPTITIIAFIIFLMINPIVFLNIDIFLETLIGQNESTTGSKRGIILTFMSIASFFSPIAMSYIVGPENKLADVYFVSAAVGLIFIAIIIARFRTFYDPVYETIKIKETLTRTIKNRDIKIVFYAQFLLQFFYAWAVIYFPLYLATVIGLDWVSIGKIIAAGLLAFVIFEYPAGRLADEKIGEKELMALGFVFMALSSASIAYIETTDILVWMVVIFITRIGASLVEVTSESYFFKQVRGDDSNLISIFRLLRPLASLIGAIIGTISLLLMPFNLIFIILGFILVTGIFVTTKLTDTK